MDDIKKKQVLEEAKKLMPEYEFKLGTITKRNDCQKDALFIASGDGMAAPIFYLDDYSHLDPHEMAEKARELINGFSINQEELKERLLSPEFIKENVRLQMLNAERNREYLKGKPAFPVGADMAAVLYISLGENGEAKAFLTDAIIDQMGMNVEELKAAALKNMWENKRVQSMTDTITDIVLDIENTSHKESAELILEQLKEGTMQDMIIISNSEKMDGAATILCPEFAEQCNQNLVLLPSSVHEMIAIPYDNGTDLRELQKMVEEINRTSVSSQDFLSDNVYFFDAQKKSVSLACDKYGLVPLCDDSKLVLQTATIKR